MTVLRHSSESSFASLRYALMLVVGGVLSIAIGCEQVAEPIEKTTSRTAGTVLLTIKVPQQDELVVDVPCSEDSTVFSIMERARNMGDLDFESRGQGDTVFLTSIVGVENGGASGDNWVYRVNGELADTSCGVFEVKPKDKIVWSYGKVEF